MTSLTLTLGRSRTLHRLLAIVPVYPIAGFVLRRVPWQRQLSAIDVAYRITSLDQLSVAAGLFEHEEYAPALQDWLVETFLDIGCNAGYFSVWLGTRYGRVTLRGLLIDAHPRMVGEAEWHLRRNGLIGCSVVLGAVGLAPGIESTEFHLNPSTSGSSVLPFNRKQLPVKGEIEHITVPTLVVAKAWRSKFGNAIVDLLKLDIEGLELDFLSFEASFLEQSVRRVVVEWHKWHVPFDQLDKQFAAMSFERRGVHNENELVGLAVYDNIRLSGLNP